MLKRECRIDDRVKVTDCKCAGVIIRTEGSASRTAVMVEHTKICKFHTDKRGARWWYPPSTLERVPSPAMSAWHDFVEKEGV